MQHHFNSILLGLCLSAATTASAQTGEASFNENFCDSTLRLDYIFSGNATTQRISLDKLNRRAGMASTSVWLSCRWRATDK